ncbi:MAG: hypothetical protein AAF557_08280 [Pseudomonadota bacterium]
MFWSRNLIDDDTAEWVEEGFNWLIRTYGAEAYFVETQLILPTRDFFQSPGGTGHEAALAVFDEVRGHMGMSNWSCELIRQDADPDAHVAQGLSVQDVEQSPGGTFGYDGEGFTITYSPNLMKQPLSFLNMLSHELAHYLLAADVENAPGGADAHEVMTDLAAIYAGFGVIQLEGGMIATGYQNPFEIGWQIGNLGYLSSEVRAYALALFVLSKQIDPKIAASHLSTDKAKLFRGGLRMLDRRSDSVRRIRALAS